MKSFTVCLPLRPDTVVLSTLDFNVTNLTTFRYDAQNQTMEVASRFFPALIGKGGSVIRKLQEDSGARIDLDRNRSVVKIQGEEEAMAKAKELIEAILAEEGWSTDMADDAVEVDERDIGTLRKSL